MTRIQRYSSYTFTLFTTLHLATTSLIPLATQSVPASESYLLLAREIYHTPLSEPLLVAIPLLAHVASGVAIRLLRRSHNLKRYGGATPGVYALHRARQATNLSTSSTSSTSSAVRIWPHLSYISLSGYASAGLLAAHVFLNRGLPLLVEGDSADVGLAYVGHGFARHAALAWPGYLALLGAVCGHMVWGWAKWLGLSDRAAWQVRVATGNKAADKRIRSRRRNMWWAIHGVAAALAGLWAAGGLGVVARSGKTPGWVGGVYDGLFDKVPLL